MYVFILYYIYLYCMYIYLYCEYIYLLWVYIFICVYIYLYTYTSIAFIYIALTISLSLLIFSSQKKLQTPPHAPMQKVLLRVILKLLHLAHFRSTHLLGSHPRVRNQFFRNFSRQERNAPDIWYFPVSLQIPAYFWQICTFVSDCLAGKSSFWAMTAL